MVQEVTGHTRSSRDALKSKSREMEETPTAEFKAKMEGDSDKQWVWGGMGALERTMQLTHI